MSASIYLFDPKRLGVAMPASLKDFGAILERHGNTKDGTNRAFVELGKRLEARFPPREAIGAESVWLASPAQEAALLQSAIWNLGLPDRELTAVERFIVSAAGELGLVALDDQIGIGFLPGGRIVPEDRRVLWEGVLAALDSGELIEGENGIRKHVLPALHAVLEPHGFAPAERIGEHFKFIRTLGPIRQEVSIGAKRYGYIDIFFIVYHDALAAFWYAQHPKAVFELAAFFLNLDFFHPGPERFGRWSVCHPRDVRPLLEMMQRKVLPLADFCRDLHGLDQLLNDESADTIRNGRPQLMGPRRPAGSDGSESIRDGHHTWSRLAIAHLSGNPREAEIAAEVDRLFEKPGNRRDEYQLAKAGLPAIEPLARWRDAAQHRAARRPIPGTLLDRPRDPLSPRVHHWEIAHRLADEAEADPAAFWSLHAAPDGGQRLTELWEAHGATLPADHRLASAGLSREVLALPVTGGRSPLEVLLITFPPPIGRDEMAYLAVGRDTTANVVYRYGNTPLRHAGEAGTEIVFKRGGITTHAGFGQPITRQRFLEYIEEDFAKATPG